MEENQELTPDELANLAALVSSVEAALEADELHAAAGIPVLDEYCSDSEHAGGWRCPECWEALEQKAEDEAAAYEADDGSNGWPKWT